jgi:hypothetical protein
MLHLCDPQVAKRLGNLAFEHAQNFSWEEVAIRMVAALKNGRSP